MLHIDMENWENCEGFMCLYIMLSVAKYYLYYTHLKAVFSGLISVVTAQQWSEKMKLL